MINEVIKWVLILGAVANVLWFIPIRRKDFLFIPRLWKRMRFSMLPEIIALYIVTIAVTLVLMVYVPVLRWGWANYFFGFGTNVLLSPVANYLTSGTNSGLYVVQVFLAVLLFLMPRFCLEEEKAFRKGQVAWSDITFNSIGFGLMHLFVGIPFAVGIALIFPGFFLGWKYRKAYLRLIENRYLSHNAEDDATLVSAAYHCLYNSILLGLALIITFFI